MRKYLSVLVMVTFLTLVAGCGGGKTVKTDQGTLNVKGDKVEVKTENGKSVISGSDSGVSLPEGYPKEIVPVIDGGKVVMANTSDKEKSYALFVITSRDAKEVYNFYQDALKASITKNLDLGDSYALYGAKGNNEFSVLISVQKEDGKNQTGVNISIYTKK